MRTRWIGVVLIIAALTLPSPSLAQIRTFSPPIYRLNISEPEPPPRGTSFTEYIGNPEKGSGGDFSDIDFPIFTVFYPVEYIDFVISWKGEAEPIGTLSSPSGKHSTVNLHNSCVEPSDIDPYCSVQLIGGYGMELGEYHFVLSDKADGSILNEHRWRVEYPKKPFLAQYRLINGEYPEDTMRWKAVAVMGFAPQQTLTFNFYCPYGDGSLFYGTFIAQRTFKTGSEGALYIEIEIALDVDWPCYSPYIVTMVADYAPDYSYTAPWENFGGTSPVSDDYPLVPSKPNIYIGAKIAVSANEEHEFSAHLEPSERSPKLDLHERETFTLLDGPILSDDDYWWSVKTRDGYIGWMREIDLFILYSDY
ncbi:MAG: hypothetical protein KF716_10640 [Anaerolineae bacterium]|nr:hypothetical protein [Anaerolineae bacterium]